MSGETSAGRRRLVGVRETPIGLDEAYAAVGDPAAGAVALFVGTVRDHDGGASVERLDYSAHPSVEATLAEVVDRVGERHDVIGLAALHRTGPLAIGDVAVVVAVSSAHRADAFAAARDLIDTLKSTVPIWKHQVFGDGSDEWVGSP